MKTLPALESGPLTRQSDGMNHVYSLDGFWEEKDGEKKFWAACDYPETRKGFLEAGGETFWVEFEGQGQPLILVHGGPGVDHRYFHPRFSSLAETRSLIYYDMRGHYMSPQSLSSRSHGVLEDAHDLESLRKALGLDKIDLLGHSYGGHAVLAYVQKYPENVRSIILVSAPLGEADEDVDRRIESAPITKKMEEAESEEEYDKLYFQFYFHKTPPPDVLRINQLVQKAYGSLKNKLLMEAYEHDKTVLNQKGIFSGLKIPALVIAGRHDLIVNVDAIRQVVEYSSKTEFKIYEESKHDPFVDEPERFTKDVSEFLTSSDL